jgi:DNA polymerase elongation subunit (family B)
MNLYEDTDSVFIKNRSGIATIDQNEKILSLFRKETGLPISMEHNFKFLVLLPLEASKKMEALKQYYGVTHEEQLVVTGVEIRRHDTPNLVKEFQTELLSTLFHCKSKEEIINKGYETAHSLVTKAIDRIMIGAEDVTKMIL